MVDVTIQSTPITVTVQDQAPIVVQISAAQGLPGTIILSGTGSPPDATGLADGTVYYQYI